MTLLNMLCAHTIPHKLLSTVCALACRQTGLVDIFAYLVDIVFLIDFVVFTFFVGYYFVNQSSDKTLVAHWAPHITFCELEPCFLKLHLYVPAGPLTRRCTAKLNRGIVSREVSREFVSKIGGSDLRSSMHVHG